MRLRLIEIRTATQHIVLVTNAPAEEFPAELTGRIYWRRWRIELFFCWIKCILRKGHLFAESLRRGAPKPGRRNLLGSRVWGPI